MSRESSSGAELLCATLERMGATCVFGLPGTQNVALFEALRRSRLRTVAPTHELAAAFMANGYYRASGRIGVLTSIPGPGFAYTLAGLAEALLDSAAVLYIVQKRAEAPERKFHQQAIDQEAIAGPLVKEIFRIERVEEVEEIIERACAAALGGEPGPVLAQFDGVVLGQQVATRQRHSAGASQSGAAPSPHLCAQQFETAVRQLAAASRVVILAGEGAIPATAALRELAELLQAPVMATVEARGVLPEDHPLALVFDSGDASVEPLNALVNRCDLVLALGCKFTHNRTFGYQLRLPREKLLHVAASEEVLGANYPAQLAVCSDVATFLDAVLGHRKELEARASGWDERTLADFRSAADQGPDQLPEPRVLGVDPQTPSAFFAALRRAAPRDLCLVTDSGSHQLLARRYYRALALRGLIVPSDFQSMGFGLPAAIGAKLAAPERPVAALIGDGGLAMTGMELLTAVREKIPVTVIVFNDGALGMIRQQQLAAYGHSHATELRNPDLAQFAASLGAGYVRLEGDAETTLRRALASPTTTLVEVMLENSPAMRAQHALGLARKAARNLLAPRLFDWLKRRLRPPRA